MEYILHKMNRNIGKTNSLQIIVLAIAIHSCLSIIMIYIHLVFYFDTHFSKHHSEHNHSNVGKIAQIISEDDLPLNLIHNNVIKSNNISDMGWFTDHSKWNVFVNCFNNKWSLCHQIYSTKCNSDRSRAIYQFIPIRRDINLYRLQISLRATAEQLIEQNNEAFYGMLVLIKFEDSSQQIIRLQFPTELELWTKRKYRFKNPLKIRIDSITVMIVCFGYSGTVSFTDIRVSPISEIKENNNNKQIDSTDRFGRWCHNSYKPVDQSQHLSYEKMTITSTPGSKSRTKSEITFVTQLSMDRLIILERSLQSWVGPISIAIFIPVKSLKEGIQEWHRLYITKKLRNLNLTQESHVNLVSGLEGDDYPINGLRNIAMKHVTTKFMFITDADFQPCPEFGIRFMSIFTKHKYNWKTAFVVPAFEYMETPQKEDPIPKTKDEFMQLIHRDEPIVQPFRLLESSDAHRLTNYWKWYYATNPYDVFGYLDKYEPYIVVEKTNDFPLFDERLKNYGMNKVMHSTELFAQNYKFIVLPNVWTTHLPHKTSQYSQTFLQSVDTKLKNRAVRFEVLRDIIEKYNIKLYNCF